MVIENFLSSVHDLPCLNLFQEHHVRTGCGSVSVIVYGDQDKPALITYPDLALNCKCIMSYLLCCFCMLLYNY
jgi:hypothetical protein